MTTEFLLAGFGGQGILFAGKFLAYYGLISGSQVSWLPSYGPEMRGGTANCSVIISDAPVGSPIVSSPDVLVAMNLPSLDKFENAVKKGGTVFVDSALISRRVTRTDIKTVYIPSTRLASDNGIPTLANMIMMGRVMSELGLNDAQAISKTLEKVISAKRTDMLEINKKALSLGAEGV